VNSVLVTGASRGIGLEFARRYLDAGWRVFAASRSAGDSCGLLDLGSQFGNRLIIDQLDVTDEGSRRRLYKTISSRIGKLDMLINNAGVISGDEARIRPFGELNQDDLCKTILVNSIAPLMMVERLFPLLAKSPNAVVVNITSDNGSISVKRSRGKYGYCASKAALKMNSKILSFELKDSGIVVVALHPGWVRTGMTRGEPAPLEPAESVGGMMRVIESLRMEDSGKFLDWQGNELPW
jgi:NAD(P)-dependent dehydrogenase (short-subunit alcohol dehydrogenase family)